MRYVLLKHNKQGDFHVDFMLDCGEDRLLTWQISDKNLTNYLIDDEKFLDFTKSPNGIDRTFYSKCRRIFDHRRKYLDFCGDLGDDRGHVTRVECGTWELLEFTAHQLTIKTSGTRVADNTPIIRQWQFEPPLGMVIEPDGTTLTRLMHLLPPPSDENWLVSCRLL